MRTFVWWFCIGALTTLGVIMVQGGVRDLLYESSSVSTMDEVLSMSTTVLGGGILAGCIALIFNRLR